MNTRRKESPMNINETVADKEVSRITARLDALGRNNGSVAPTTPQERVPMLQRAEEIGEQNTSRFIQGLS